MVKILIPNYSEYQHYQQRRPPWIKIHRKILDDFKFMSLKGKEQMLLICLWILAAENPVEEDFGVVKLVGLEELPWRLRGLEATQRGGGIESLRTLKSHGFINFDDDLGSRGQVASTALASRKQSADSETETETETETEGEREIAGPPAPAGEVVVAKPVKKSWAREAAEDWDARFGKGSAAPGRIGSGLTRLVKAHGWPVVRPVWQRYLDEKDPQYTSPQDFAAKYATWADGTSLSGGATIETHNRSERQRFLDGEKRLQSERGLDRMLPPGKT